MDSVRLQVKYETKDLLTKLGKRMSWPRRIHDQRIIMHATELNLAVQGKQTKLKFKNFST